MVVAVLVLLVLVVLVFFSVCLCLPIFSTSPAYFCSQSRPHIFFLEHQQWHMSRNRKKRKKRFKNYFFYQKRKLLLAWLLLSNKAMCEVGTQEKYIFPVHSQLKPKNFCFCLGSTFHLCPCFMVVAVAVELVESGENF